MLALPARILVVGGSTCAALACAALAVGGWVWPLSMPGRAPVALPGLRVEGHPIADGEALRGQVASFARDLLAQRVRLRAPRRAHAEAPLVDASLGDLGLSVDVDATVARATGVGRSGDAWTRALAAARARRGEVDVPLVRTFDRSVIRQRLARLKEDLDVPPRPARLDLGRHAVIADRAGAAVDLDGAAFAVERVAFGASPPGDLEVPTVPVPAEVSADSLSKIDVSRVLASFDTYFSRQGDQASRARNVEAAASHLDGLVVGPGAIASFNEVVGPRIEENGFFKAFEIYKGEYVEGMGGGTCQVASTVHAAAFYAGLDILERLPHSRPSAYITPGLDATVVYPTVDLRLRNPFTFPVVFHAVTSGPRLHVEVLGADKPVAVELVKEVLSTTPYDRKVEEDRAFTRPKRTQKGVDGLELRRERVMAYIHHGPYRVETSIDRYPPAQEIWKVPPGFDEDLLPPLGEDPPSDGGVPEHAPDGGAPARI